jgi:hypothetical protein
MAILPDFAAATFEPGAAIDNPYFPLEPGKIYSHGGTTTNEDTGAVDTERNDFFVTFEGKTIEGVETVVVRDTAYLNGVLIEDTLDWFAQDTGGNVWYLGENAYNYEFDDDGAYVESNNDGSWEAGVDGAVPGWIMKAEPEFTTSYYQEFSEGVAEDEGILADVGLAISGPTGDYEAVIRTIDSSALEPDTVAFKYFAPGVGQVREEEAPDGDGVPEITVDLLGVRDVSRDDGVVDDNDDDSGAAIVSRRDDVDDDDDNGDDTDDDDADDEEDGGDDADETETHKGNDGNGDGNANGDASDVQVTFLGADADSTDAVGAYTVDSETGVIGEGRILFANTGDLTGGDSTTVAVSEGETLGLFVVPGGNGNGVDLSEFAEGGLFFSNILTNEAATIDDGLSPLVSSEDGDYLPLSIFSALGNDDGFNFLNPAAGVYGVELASDGAGGDDDATIFGFENTLITDATFDGDYDDVVVSVSDDSLTDDALTDEALAAGSEPMGAEMDVLIA